MGLSYLIMPRLKITTKYPLNANGQYIDSGMSVMISTIYPVSMMCSQIAPEVNRAFLAIYGVDLKKMNALNSAYLRVEKC